MRHLKHASFDAKTLAPHFGHSQSPGREAGRRSCLGAAAAASPEPAAFAGSFAGSCGGVGAAAGAAAGASSIFTSFPLTIFMGMLGAKEAHAHGQRTVESLTGCDGMRRWSTKK